MFGRTAVLTLIFGLLIPQVPPARGETRPRFGLADIFEIEYASRPQISPDGDRVAFLRNHMDRHQDQRRANLWILATDGKSAPVPITTGSENVAEARWSPDGDRLAYVQKTKHGSQIFLHWLASGRTAQLTHLERSPSGLRWSPDGRQLAFSMLVPKRRKPYIQLPPKPRGAKWADPPKLIDSLNYRSDGRGYLEDGRHHLFVLPADGGTPRQLTTGDFDHKTPPAWSPDGGALVFSANRNPDPDRNPLNTDLYELRIRTGKIRALTDGAGPAEEPVLSPDGRWIAFLGFEDERSSYHASKIYVMPRGGGKPRRLAKTLDRDPYALAWSAAHNGPLFLYENEGDTHVGWARLDGKVEVVARRVGGETIGRPYSSGSFSVAENGTIAFTRVSTQRPADVALCTHPLRRVRQLTHLNEDLLANRQLGRVRAIRFRSSHDKRPIQAWVVTPPGYSAARDKKFPLILEIHGGPYANYGERFSAEVQLYAAAGYVVVYANPRGSTGYGLEFARLIHHNYPGEDYDDLMSAVDRVVATDRIDKDNLFVTGGSGGGILTAWIVGKTTRFRAAVAAKPVINWYSLALTSDSYAYFTRYWFPGPPWEHAAEFHRRSPLSLVAQVKTPTMLMTGEEDYRTPISESEQFYQALKLRNVETALVRIPGASHGIARRPTHLMAKVAYILKWFAQHRATAASHPDKRRDPQSKPPEPKGAAGRGR